MTDIQKTHWLQNPNRNYLGHQDLPNGKNQTLTLKSGNWEAVKNPKINTSTEKRVLRFEEEGLEYDDKQHKSVFKWVKPFICNETNALEICKKLQIEFIEDCIGAKITFIIREVKYGKIATRALRILDARKDSLIKINKQDLQEISDLIEKQDETNSQKICKAFGIKSLLELPKEKFELVKKGIQKYIGNENS